MEPDQSTEADRVKAWINNERITEWATSDHPSQNLDLDGGINKTSYAMEVGRDNYGGGEAYFEGYMADYVYIDGTQYDPTYFGEYDSDSPQIFKPKKIAGLTFGTNGFYLDFADSSNLGNDKNGGTDLTEVNIAAADQCDDSPTNNFATLNPLQASLPTGSVHQGMFDGNLGSWTSSADNSADYRQWSSIAIPHTGKWYVETKWTRNSGTHTKARMGILAFHDDVTHGVVLDGDFDKIVNGSSSSYATGSVAYGEIFGSLYDLANNQVTFYEAGSSLGTISWTPNADYTYFLKYGIRDYRGGGRQSARETASRVDAGAIAKTVLKKLIGKKFKVVGGVIQLGLLGCNKNNWNDKEIQKNPFFCPDKKAIKLWEKYLLAVRKAGSSCGAVIELRASGIPAGLGSPIYSKLDSDLAGALMSINAVKGVNIGAGMSAAFLSGEENSDEIRNVKGKTKFKSNYAGGILGGISSGQEIIASFAVKPTSSILNTRETIDKNKKNTKISVRGRHDPCVGIRAVPIGEAMMACVLLDHYLLNRAQCN